jgi:hypothetical protein
MAKKLNKLMARVAALESTVAGLLGGWKAKGKRVVRKVKKAKKAKAKKVAPAHKRKASKKPAVARKPAKASASKRIPAGKTITTPAKAAVPPKVKRKAPRRKSVRVTPTVEQLAPSGAPQFVTPLDVV